MEYIFQLVMSEQHYKFSTSGTKHKTKQRLRANRRKPKASNERKLYEKCRIVTGHARPCRTCHLTRSATDLLGTGHGGSEIRWRRRMEKRRGRIRISRRRLARRRDPIQYAAQGPSCHCRRH